MAVFAEAANAIGGDLDGLANTIATCIAAVAACISTYLAAQAIKDNRQTKRAELEGQRPYFSFSDFGLRRPSVAKALSSDKELLDPRIASIEGLLTNDGHRAATNVSGAIFLLPVDPDRKAGAFPVGVADDVSPKLGWRISTTPIAIVPTDFSGIEHSPRYSDSGFFVFACIRYTDPLTSKSYNQNTLLRWPGISNGVVAGNLYATEHGDKEALLLRYQEFLKPYAEKGLLTSS